MPIDEALRNMVWERAGACCEYCRVSASVDDSYRFQLEHVIARQHLGPSTAENLALSCRHCNMYKGPNLSAIDPETGALVRLFDPRSDRWEEHFTVLPIGVVIGLTPIGRATSRLLDMNNARRRQLRTMSMRP